MSNDDRPGVEVEMEIAAEPTRRWVGRLAWVLLFAVVAAAFVYLFVLLTDSLPVALVAAGVLISYMSVAAWLAMRAGTGRQSANDKIAP